MASSVVGSLVVRLSAHTAAFSKGLKRARKTTGAFVTGVAKRFGGMFKKMLLSATVAATGIAVLVKRQMAMIDTTTKTAVKLGIATKELSRWHYAAKLSGLATTTFDMALQRMVRRVAEAAQGTGEAQEAIKTLGIDAKKLNRLTPDKMLLALSDALGKIPSQGEQLRLYFKLFDSEGVKMKNVLGQGRDAIIAMLKESDKAGASFDKFDAAKIVAAADAVTRLSASFSGLFTKLSIELAPFIKMFSDDLADGVIKAGDAAKTAEGEFSGLARSILSVAAAKDWLNRMKMYGQLGTLKTFKASIEVEKWMMKPVYGSKRERREWKDSYDSKLLPFADAIADLGKKLAAKSPAELMEQYLRDFNKKLKADEAATGLGITTPDIAEIAAAFDKAIAKSIATIKKAEDVTKQAVGPQVGGATSAMTYGSRELFNMIADRSQGPSAELEEARKRLRVLEQIRDRVPVLAEGNL